MGGKSQPSGFGVILGGFWTAEAQNPGSCGWVSILDYPDSDSMKKNEIWNGFFPIFWQGAAGLDGKNGIKGAKGDRGHQGQKGKAVSGRKGHGMVGKGSDPSWIPNSWIPPPKGLRTFLRSLPNPGKVSNSHPDLIFRSFAPVRSMSIS